MTDLNAPGTYDGKAITDLSDKRLLLARNDVAATIARFDTASPAVKRDKAEYLDRMQALLPLIEAEMERRNV